MRKFAAVLLLSVVMSLFSGCSDSSKISDLENQLEENDALRMMDNPAITFYDFYTAGITNIQILNASKEGTNLGYVLGFSDDVPFNCYDILSGEPPSIGTDPAVYPSQHENGMLYEVRSVLQLDVGGAADVWLYTYPMYHSESDDHSSLIPLRCTIPYTADRMAQLICPVYVTEGAVNIAGKAEHAGPYAIQGVEEDVYSIWSHGNYQAQVTKDRLEWPSPDEHPPFDPTPYQ